MIFARLVLMVFPALKKVEKESGGEVRGTRLDKEKASGDCVGCGNKSKEVVYIGRGY